MRNSEFIEEGQCCVKAPLLLRQTCSQKRFTLFRSRRTSQREQRQAGSIPLPHPSCLVMCASPPSSATRFKSLRKRSQCCHQRASFSGIIMHVHRVRSTTSTNLSPKAYTGITGYVCICLICAELIEANCDTRQADRVKSTAGCAK